MLYSITWCFRLTDSTDEIFETITMAFTDFSVIRPTRTFKVKDKS